ncbi:hypothetical protein [Aeromonas veronii]|uniref:hypothetical protein n=1 Tax=Aeromonas veronii TaxID=654 RepID=UPI002245825F|nr:hypothetical protein [Aeromonas veronii]MCX0437102.1 hypothetical protein [Aeromonas veronii]
MTKFKYTVGDHVIERDIETSEDGNGKVKDVLKYIAKTENQSLKVAFINRISEQQMGVDIINPDGGSCYVESDTKVSAIEIYDSNMWRKVSLIVDGYVG